MLWVAPYAPPRRATASPLTSPVVMKSAARERKGSNLVLLGLVDKARALRGPLFVVLFGFD